MKPTIKYLFAALLVIGFVAAGCNGDDENNGGDDTGMAGDAVSDTAEEDTAEEDAGEEDVEEDTGQDTAEEDTGEVERLQVASLYYRRNESNCPTSSCTFGVRVNATAGTIEKVENGSGLSRSMNNSDVDALIADVLTESTHNKMDSGWECGTVDEPDTRHEFEARIWNGSEYVESIQDVTGCIPTDSTEADADEVQRIVTYLQDLRDNYFDTQ
ncbi:MAG: hypothetical protein ACQEVA_13345 [Myxococcota bacterium]